MCSSYKRLACVAVPATAVAMLAVTVHSRAALPVQTVVLRGQAAPAFPPGSVFSQAFVPRFDGGGGVIFLAGMDVPKIQGHVEGVYRAHGQTLQRIVAQDEQFPGGIRIANFQTFPYHPTGVGPGEVVFRSGLIWPDQGNRDGLSYANASGERRVLAALGVPAPGLPGVTQTGAANFAVQPNGLLAMSGQTDAGAALWVGTVDALQPLAVAEQAAPDTEPGTAYASSHFAPFWLNRTGEVAFAPQLAGPSVTPDTDAGLFAGAPGAVRLIARGGDPAPGPGGGTFAANLATSFTNVLINNGGTVAFVTDVVGSSGTTPSVLFTGTRGALDRVASTGQAPGLPAGVNYNPSTDNRELLIDDRGTVAFYAGLYGTGINESNDNALWRGDASGVRTVAREGDAAPGLPGGTTFGELPRGEFTGNPAGWLVFKSSVIGPTTPAPGVSALWGADPEGNLFPIVRGGDVLDVGGGELRTVDDVSFASNKFGGVGQAVVLADDNRFAFHASFTDGSWGIFTTIVPEPSCAAVAAVAVAPVLRRRRC